MLPPPPIVMCFSAADPTGGAGMQADVLTIACMGCHPVSVITALTVQDTVGVEAVLPIDGGWIVDQARALLEDMPVAAFKIGLLGSVEAVAGVAEILSDYPDVPVIFDPVLASGRGDQLADEDILESMIALLLPQTTVLTPNSLELRRLAQACSDADLSSASGDSPLGPSARALVDAGCEYVLVTGTHENTDQVLNTLYGIHGKVRADSWARLPGSYHGSGCTLASALAAALALGQSLDEAVFAAQDFTWRSLESGFRPGMGQFIPNRMFWAELSDEAADAADRKELRATLAALPDE
jgi:hydroxymethylpyrimidine/phosphomethylpyrimidine kinase